MFNLSINPMHTTPLVQVEFLHQIDTTKPLLAQSSAWQIWIELEFLSIASRCPILFKMLQRVDGPYHLLVVAIMLLQPCAPDVLPYLSFGGLPGRWVIGGHELVTLLEPRIVGLHLLRRLDMPLVFQDTESFSFAEEEL